MIRYIILILIIGSMLSCDKEECDFPGNYEFVVYGEVMPYDSIYHVGDTLTLKASFGSTIYEKKTNSYFLIAGLELESGFMIFNIDTVAEKIQHKVLDYVDPIINNKYPWFIENYSSGNSSLFSKVLYIDNQYNNELKIVFKRKGTFLISFGPFSLENEMEFDGKCSNKAFDLSTELNKFLDNNSYLLKQSPNPYFVNLFNKSQTEDYKPSFAYRVID